MKISDLFLRVRALVTPRRVERELDEELAFHIERETRKHIAAGLRPIDARARALARFGPVPLAADQCRDARGTRFFDDVVRDIIYAFRTFRRAPLAAVTIVATVALGLGLVTAVFAFYDAVFLHVDGVRSPDELVAVQVERQSEAGLDEDVTFTLADYDALRRDVSIFTDAFGMSGMFTRVDGRPGRASPVTGNFFQVLGASAALGRALLPGDDERSGGAPVIVLSHVGWRKLFQSDRTVIGRRAAINGAPYEVVGVMPEGFRGIEEFVPDYWVPLSQSGRLLGDRAGWQAEVGVQLVGRLKPGISPGAATAALQTWAAGRSALTRPGRRVRVSVAPPEGFEINAVNGLLVFSPLFFAFGLILLIGCANVANLLLARGVSRQRELGIRLALGASRRRIIRQLLTESLMLALAAAACGLVVAQLFLNAALSVAITTAPPEIAQFVSLLNIPAPSLDWRAAVFLVAGALATTMFFGLAPALQATRLELVRTMRGEVTRDPRPGRARRTLITVQVGASALLVICAAVLLRGVFAAATREPGVRTSDTLRVSIENESRRGALLQALAADPVVAVVAASSFSTRGVIETSVPAGAAAAGSALGASRSRIARLLFIESLIVAALGAAVGLAFAKWSGALLVQQLSTWQTTVSLDLALDWRVLAFTAALACLSAIIAGVAPVLGLKSVAPGDAIKDAGRGIAGDRRFAVRSALVVAQVAVSLVLVVGAGLFLRTFASLNQLPLGFVPDPLLVAEVNLQASGGPPEERGARVERLRAAAAAVPGVRSATVAAERILNGGGWSSGLVGIGDAQPSLRRPALWLNATTPGWFETMGTPLRIGRDFQDGDRLGSAPVVIVNDTFVRRFLPGEPPIGQHVRMGRDSTTRYEIVGVVGDAVYTTPRDGMVATMYLPVAQQPPKSFWPTVLLTINAAPGQRAAVERDVTRVLTEADPTVAFTFGTFDQLVEATVTQERLIAMLSAFFGGLALLLAAVGLYGVVAHAVRARQTEIGLRMALGAAPSSIVRLVFQRVGVLIAAGLALGLAGSLWAVRFVEALLFQQEARDPMMLAGAAAVLVAAAGLAAWIPAVNAARLDPATVLREG